MWRSNQLAVHPFHSFHTVRELRRIVLYEEHVALLSGCTQYRDHADINCVLLGRGYDRRHISHVAQVVLLAEHLAHDDRTLKADLELDVGTGWQILLPQLLAIDHHT